MWPKFTQRIPSPSPRQRKPKIVRLSSTNYFPNKISFFRNIQTGVLFKNKILPKAREGPRDGAFGQILQLCEVPNLGIGQALA
jgi:hypothetical protein